MSRARCAHPDAVEVITRDGETVAALCPACDLQLPAAWLTCEHLAPVDVTPFSEPPGSEWMCGECGGIYWEIKEHIG